MWPRVTLRRISSGLVVLMLLALASPSNVAAQASPPPDETGVISSSVVEAAAKEPAKELDLIVVYDRRPTGNDRASLESKDGSVSVMLNTVDSVAVRMTAGRAMELAADPTGGAPTSYNVRARLSAGGPLVADVPVGNTLTLPVTAPNGTYHVTVLASNAAGPGPESAGVTFSVPIVAPPPGATSGLAVAVADQADFTWTPPSTGGTPTGYLLVASASSGGAPIAMLSLSAPRSSVTIGSIPPGTYFVRVAATNSGGPGPFSNEVTLNVAGPQPPGPPAMNPATVSSGQVTMSWTAPITGVGSA